eukprot:TRINITY_DN11987_c0_g1_i1.p1 TRINITY_DN11987_c0_g1~~TRINITY_DN11987_c0_g1_i1.p1  ORF type:complete len:295 (-),score=8.99 TRINITY_DN11987_c0_g1_i1:640-1524(-)
MCCCGHGQYSELQMTRRYETWPGNNYFFCGGRCMLGGTPYGLFITLFLIYPPIGYHLYELFNYYPLVIPILDILLVLGSSYALFACAFTEPGIQPRSPSNEQPPPPVGPNAFDEVGRPLKYCDTCHIWRSPRMKHCRSCGNCCHGFDHHCPWLGNCVGYRNYRYFFWFLLFVTILCMYTCVCAVYQIICVSQLSSSGFAHTVAQYPGLVGIALYSGVMALSLIGLCYFHMVLICTAQTTNEQIRGKYLNRTNPHDQGCINNITNALFSPIPPSLLPDMSALDNDTGTITGSQNV